MQSKQCCGGLFWYKKAHAASFAFPCSQLIALKLSSSSGFFPLLSCDVWIVGI
jgi:hypothetical protein